MSRAPSGVPPQALLTPRMAGVLERIRRVEAPAFQTLSVEHARLAYEVGAEVLDQPRAALPRIEDLMLPADDGIPLAARLYAPVPRSSTEAIPAVLFLHGGGFTVGSLETHDSLCRQLARRSGAAVLALHYRRAPEHRFPTAVDDAFAALRWLAAQAASLGLDATRLAVAGDSAGGTLAAVCALLARDAALPLRAQALITPGTAPDALGHTSRETFANGFLLDAETIAWFFAHYIDTAQRADWRFAPLNADALDGVAPAALLLAECDPLVDEGLAYADRLRWAGVPVELDVVRGVTHEFIKLGRAVPQAHAAQDFLARFLREAFQP